MILVERCGYVGFIVGLQGQRPDALGRIVDGDREGGLLFAGWRCKEKIFADKRRSVRCLECGHRARLWVGDLTRQYIVACIEIFVGNRYRKSLVERFRVLHGEFGQRTCQRSPETASLPLLRYRALFFVLPLAGLW